MIQRVIIGNWKMHTDPAQAEALAREIKQAVGEAGPAKVVVCPPFSNLPVVSDVLQGSRVEVGAQNLHWAAEGAYTGEVSGSMLKALGCDYVLIGHSERRSDRSDTVELTGLKLRAALGAGLSPVLCVGESLHHRQHGMTRSIVGSQISPIFFMESSDVSRLLVAYEPVWAIGSGEAALPQDADEVCGFIRDWIGRIHGDDQSRSVPVLYGGSVNAENVSGFLSRPNVDGVLVGGASLKVDTFAALVRSSEEAAG